MCPVRTVTYVSGRTGQISVSPKNAQGNTGVTAQSKRNQRPSLADCGAFQAEVALGADRFFSNSTKLLSASI